MGRCSKTILGILISVALSANGIPAFASAENTIIYENETFEEYVTNDAQDFFEVSGTADVIVAETDKSNKSLKINKKSMLYSEISRGFAPISDDVIIQFDIKFEGSTVPWGCSVNSGNGSVSDIVTANEDGSIATSEGKKYWGFGKNDWKNIAILYSPDIKRFSVYINRSNKLADWVMNDISFDSLSGITFFMSPAESGDTNVYIDNFRVYSGTKILNDGYFPKSVYNPESIEYIEKDIAVSDEISMSDNFDNTLIKIYNKGNIVQIMEEKENKFLHFEEKNGSECYAEYTDGMGLGIQYNTIYSVDVRSTKYSGISRLFEFRLKPGSVTSVNVYICNGFLYLYNGKKIGEMKRNAWQNITLAVDFLTRYFDVYLDGDKIAEDIPLQAKMGTLPSLLRFYCSGGHSNNLDIDNVLVYYGIEPRKVLDNSTISGYPIETTLHYWELDKEPKDLLSGKLAYNAITSSVFLNDEKIRTEENGAFLDGRIIYIPVEKTAQRLGKQITQQGNIITYSNVQMIVNDSKLICGGRVVNLSAPVIEKNGIIYAPVDAFGKNKMLDEDVFYDERGIVVFGLSELTDEKERAIVKFMQFERPSKQEILETYKASGIENVHPIILMTQAYFDIIKYNINTDAKSKELYEKVSNIYKNVEKIPVSVYTL